jgi:hypothetical protein
MIRRYHNVFYAYRGQAPGDPLLNGPRQLENNVTRALVVTLQHAGADVTARFVRELQTSDIPRRSSHTTWRSRTGIRPAPAWCCSA